LAVRRRLLPGVSDDSKFFLHLQAIRHYSTKTKVLLVDDFEKYVHPGQGAQWMQVEHFDYPYSSTDTGLAKMLSALTGRIDR